MKIPNAKSPNPREISDLKSESWEIPPFGISLAFGVLGFGIF
jgi:hypothetical protein